MAHSYQRCLYHIVFSTRQRENTIGADWMTRLWDYMAAIARDHGMETLTVGGVGNHVHLLVLIPTKLAVTDAIRQLKACSSKWIHEVVGVQGFGWQTGYGAFTIGVSQIGPTQEYIANQDQHHRKVSFEDEYRAFLTKNGIELDEWILD